MFRNMRRRLRYKIVSKFSPFEKGPPQMRGGEGREGFLQILIYSLGFRI